MIDVEKERTYALNWARRWFPRRRRNKRPSLQTMYRWSTEGYHGVVLETVQVGSTRCTTKKSCVRFIERISNLSPRLQNVTAPGRPANLEQIDTALEKTGFDRVPARPRAKPDI